MSFFGSSAVKPKAQVVKKVTLSRKAVPNPHPPAQPSSRSSHAASPARSKVSQLKRNTATSRRQSGTPSSPESSSTNAPSSRKRVFGSPATPQFSSSDDDEDSGDLLGPSRKRAKTSTPQIEVDLKRRLALEESSAATGIYEGSIVHGADLTSGREAVNFVPVFPSSSGEALDVELQYPSFWLPERFRIVAPRQSDGFDPIVDIRETIDHICQHFLPQSDGRKLLDDATGIVRRLRRACYNRLKEHAEDDFRDAVQEFNQEISKLRKNGTIGRHLGEQHHLDLSLIKRILEQVYQRTVSPRVESLRKYENGSDNVYGELLPRFVSKIFKDTGLKSDQVFVDLGSGVGNVVLQAALEVGCESWGCEMMENPCDLAELQQKEFEARCHMWGLSVGAVHLERGDFLANTATASVLKRADVVVVNNQAFTTSLNDKLVMKFLDLKEGCKIVSLKSFKPAGHRLQQRNMHNPINLLNVRELEYFSDMVSWTNQGGHYYVAMKDSRELRAFQKGMSK